MEGSKKTLDCLLFVVSTEKAAEDCREGVETCHPNLITVFLPYRKDNGFFKIEEENDVENALGILQNTFFSFFLLLIHHFLTLDRLESKILKLSLYHKW